MRAFTGVRSQPGERACFVHLPQDDGTLPQVVRTEAQPLGRAAVARPAAVPARDVQRLVVVAYRHVAEGQAAQRVGAEGVLAEGGVFLGQGGFGAVQEQYGPFAQAQLLCAQVAQGRAEGILRIPGDARDAQAQLGHVGAARFGGGVGIEQVQVPGDFGAAPHGVRPRGVVVAGNGETPHPLPGEIRQVLRYDFHVARPRLWGCRRGLPK